MRLGHCNITVDIDEDVIIRIVVCVWTVGVTGQERYPGGCQGRQLDGGWSWCVTVQKVSFVFIFTSGHRCCIVKIGSGD